MFTTPNWSTSLGRTWEGDGVRARVCWQHWGGFHVRPQVGARMRVRARARACAHVCVSSTQGSIALRPTHCCCALDSRMPDHPPAGAHGGPPRASHLPGPGPAAGARARWSPAPPGRETLRAPPATRLVSAPTSVLCFTGESAGSHSASACVRADAARGRRCVCMCMCLCVCVCWGGGWRVPLAAARAGSWREQAAPPAACSARCPQGAQLSCKNP